MALKQLHSLLLPLLHSHLELRTPRRPAGCLASSCPPLCLRRAKTGAYGSPGSGLASQHGSISAASPFGVSLGQSQPQMFTPGSSLSSASAGNRSPHPFSDSQSALAMIANPTLTLVLLVLDCMCARAKPTSIPTARASARCCPFVPRYWGASHASTTACSARDSTDSRSTDSATDTYTARGGVSKIGPNGHMETRR